jgi:glutathione S-transferase
MKLYLNKTSPYARLIHVLLLETGLASETALIDADPWSAAPDLVAANPAGKIPALSLDDGTHLAESACIADYLIHRSGASMLSPLSHPDAPARLAILGQGRAAMDCAFSSVIQDRFAPGSPLSARWLARLPRIAARLDALYRERAGGAACDLADLTCAVAFDYIGFRLPGIDWRASAPQLSRQVGAILERPSLLATRPA